MSDYVSQKDKLTAHLEKLQSRHKELDKHLENTYSNITVNEEVRRIKTEKLWLKDEIYRIHRQLNDLSITR